MTRRPSSTGMLAEAARDLDQPWRRRAACRGQADLMDPPWEMDRDEEREALELCWRCPVLWPCRTWVLGLREETDGGGVCGGLTDKERTKARRRHRRKAVPQ